MHYLQPALTLSTRDAVHQLADEHGWLINFDQRGRIGLEYDGITIVIEWDRRGEVVTASRRGDHRRLDLYPHHIEKRDTVLRWLADETA